MSVATTHNGPIEIAYETLGPSDGDPLLLVMGTGGQMLSWPDRFCAQLVGHGFQVTRFDNRDAGLSTHLTSAGAPSHLTMVLHPTRAPYALLDMVDDAMAVLDALGWDSAHLVGVSQGGMIAQAAATDRPDRVRTLTSISSTPAPKIGKPKGRTLARIVRAANPKKIKTSDDLAAYLIGLARVVGSPAYPADEASLRELAHHCFERSGGLDLDTIKRQTAALVAAGDRRAALATVRAPTLVIHGDCDPLIRPEGGRATADAIPGARLVTYPGMGHDLPEALWTPIIDQIVALAGTTLQRAD